jgi:hypothetical protein
MARRVEHADVLDLQLIQRVEDDVTSAMRRKPAQEGRTAGVLRSLAPYSEALRALTDRVLGTLVRRGSFARPLYGATGRGLAELGDRRATPHLAQALAADDAGGLATLSAACFVEDAELGEPLARVAMSRHPQLAFAAEVARVARRESDGEHVANVAPMIKESHRIALCTELFVPLLWREPLPAAIAPALSVLRDAERHLGRWLVLADVGVRAGDETPLREARERAVEGPSSARAAWAMVAWALERPAQPAALRPTVELVARLSDRPSADRDLTFLYRLGEAGVPAARAMLEHLAKGSLSHEAAVRAALVLALQYGRTDLVELLHALAKNPRREPLRGLAAAALWDLRDTATATELACSMLGSRQLQTAAWAALIQAHSALGRAEQRVLTEQNFRRIQVGWVE